MSRCNECQFDPCRCEDLASRQPPGLAGNSSCWNEHWSDALACHPKQIPAMMERNKRHGVVGIEYHPEDGRAHGNRMAIRDLCHLEGVHNRDGGYGDDHATDSPLDFSVDRE